MGDGVGCEGGGGVARGLGKGGNIGTRGWVEREEEVRWGCGDVGICGGLDWARNWGVVDRGGVSWSELEGGVGRCRVMMIAV